MAITDSLFTAPRVRAVVTAGYQALEERRDEINDLNVYPVPDGDTGNNLALTVRAVLEDLRSLPDDSPADRVAASVSRAALMGARGNSGVILSQMVRGAMDALADADAFNDRAIVGAFSAANKAAYRAIRKPVEGTMLTVLREMSEAADDHQGEDHRQLITAVLRAGWDSVHRTPTLLSVLADAGVVDAGGFGLLVLLEGMVGGAEGPELTAGIDLDILAGKPESGRGGMREENVGEFAYCTSFLLLGEGVEPRPLEGSLENLGDSLLVVGDRGQVKVHIHTNDPGAVLSLATAKGSLREVEIDNMLVQTAEREARLSAHEHAAARIAPLNSRKAPKPATQVVAVVAGEGNKRLFQSMGAHLLVEGGQTMNPSAEELASALEAATADAVLILPNNSNVILAAEQARQMADREVHVVRTKSIQAGIMAMVAYDPESPAEINVEAMEDALDGLRTAEVTRAVRDSQLNGLQIREGQFLGLLDGELIVAEGEFEDAVTALVERLLEQPAEVLTVLLGESELGERPAAVLKGLAERYPDLEIEVHKGDQPHYPLLMAVE